MTNLISTKIIWQIHGKYKKNIIGKNSNKSAQRLSLYVNDKTISDSTDIANKFNYFFMSIGPLLTEKNIYSSSSSCH